MKHRLLVILFITLFPVCLISQSLNLFDIDFSKYPIIKGKFYAFDEHGLQLYPNINDLNLFENGVEREIISVSCPSPKPPDTLSSVLTIDISGSMYGINLELAKAGANVWINYLSAGINECAITSFDDNNYLNQDFTSDKRRLLETINKLEPNGGTSFDAALIDKMAGALLISKSGKYSKVIVLLTDGHAGLSNSTEVISTAIEQDCRIFVVTLNGICPEDLKEVTIKTGGNWYDMIQSKKEIEDVYKLIFSIARSNSACTIEWLSKISCTAGNTTIELNFDNLKATSQYFKASDAIAELNASPSYITFGKRNLGVKYDTTITLTAINGDFTVFSIDPKYGSATDFEFKGLDFPFMILKGTTKEIILSYYPKDSSFQNLGYEIITDLCNSYISANGGYFNKRKFDQTLKLTHPNGGEIFLAGSDTNITWEGISPNETVSLDYSIDDGRTWKNITNTASNLKYNWENIPKPGSHECLVKVQQFIKKASDTNNCLWTSNLHTRDVNEVIFSPFGNLVFSSSNDKNIHIYDAYTGNLVKTLTGHSNSVNCIAHSPVNNILISGSWQELSVWNVNTGNLIKSFIAHDGQIESVDYHPSGNRVVSTGYNTIKIWDVNTWLAIKTININGVAFKVSYDNSGNRIVVSTTVGTIIVLDANTGSELFTIKDFSKYIYSAEFSPDDSKIVSGGLDGKVRIWNSYTGEHIKTLIGHPATIYSCSFSPDGNRIATASYDMAIKVWDVNTGKLITTLEGHTASVRSVKFDPNGILIASGGFDHKVKVWQIDDTPIQSDISDTLFSIVVPKPDAIDIDMKQCLVGKQKDSLILEFVLNKSEWGFRVVSIYFQGNDAKAFSLVSGLPEYDVDAGSNYFGEFRFSPTEERIYNAEIVIVTQSDTIYKKIRGEGVLNPIELSSNYIDFGLVELGNRKDTINTSTIRNLGNYPITITNTKHSYPNDKDFSTIAGGGNFVLQPGEVHYMDLRFTPEDEGRTSGTLLFEYDSFGSPAVIQLFGEGVAPNPKISAIVNKSPVILCEEEGVAEIVVSNTGGKPLIIDELNLTGSDKDNFYVLSVLPITVLPKDSVEIYVGFKSDEIGEKVIDLEIKSNSIPDSNFALLISAKKEKVQLVADELIDLGIICPLEESEFDIVISNAGTINSTAKISSTDNIIITGSNISIETDESYTIKAKFRAPDKSGEINEQIIITDDICGIVTIVQINGVIELPALVSKDIEFISMVGNSKQEILRIENSSNRNISVTGISNIFEPFKIIGNPFPFVIEPTSHFDLIIEYNPTDSDITKQTIQINVAECNYIKEVNFTGYPTIDNIKLSIGNFEAYPGDIITVPIILEMNQNFNTEDIDKLSFDLFFNPTLLNAVDYNSIQIDDKTAKISLEGFKSGDLSGEIIKSIKFEVGLGNADNCALVIDNAKMHDKLIDIDLINGSFKLLGICYEGGTRLLNPSGSEFMINVSPNPVSDKFKIEIDLLEKGETTLLITNSIGMEIFSRKFLNQTGFIEISIDSKLFPNGMYFINLITPTINKTVKFHVLR